MIIPLQISRTAARQPKRRGGEHRGPSAHRSQRRRSAGWRLGTGAARLAALALLAAIVAAPAALWGAAATTRPNIVLLMTDDQGWGETGYNGHPHVKTPVLDEIARTGLRLDRFYAASSMCSPTRASVMNGRHANRSGTFGANWSTRPEEITVAQILKQAGYRTGHFGKWHLGPVKQDSAVNPNRLGFDESLSHDNFFELNPPLSHNGAAPEIRPGEGSQVIIDAATSFARQAQRENKPFFLVVWFGSPHTPYEALPEDLGLYQAVSNPEMRARFAEITAMDRAIGSFRAALRQMGAAENTLLWFNSDNGIMFDVEEFNGPWRGRKRDIYEGGFLVPGLIEWPAVIRQSRRSQVRCVTSDILPTLLDLLQLRHPDPRRPLDGISLRRLIVDGTMTERPKPIGFWIYPLSTEADNASWLPAGELKGTWRTFSNKRHPVAKTANFEGEAAWTENRYKLIVGARRGPPRLELYDLLADPKEESNLAAAHPDVVRRMKAELENWQRSVERSLSGADY